MHACKWVWSTSAWVIRGDRKHQKINKMLQMKCKIKCRKPDNCHVCLLVSFFLLLFYLLISPLCQLDNFTPWFLIWLNLAADAEYRWTLCSQNDSCHFDLEVLNIDQKCSYLLIHCHHHSKYSSVWNPDVFCTFFFFLHPYFFKYNS